MATFKIIPCTLKQANDFIELFHRHHEPVTGHRFSICAIDKNNCIIGVAVVGRPVGRKCRQYVWAEVTRLCTDGTPNVCSFLYARCAKIAQLMGFKLIQTYILETESGISLKAAGWTCEGVNRPNGVGWNNRKNRNKKQPTCAKIRYRKYFDRSFE